MRKLDQVRNVEGEGLPEVVGKEAKWGCRPPPGSRGRGRGKVLSAEPPAYPSHDLPSEGSTVPMRMEDTHPMEGWGGRRRAGLPLQQPNLNPTPANKADMLVPLLTEGCLRSRVS